jgi:hypothetical protein
MGNIVSGFQNPLRPERPPLAGQSGLQALFRAEQIDNYRKQVNDSPINRAARAGQDYLPSPHSIQRAIPPADPAEPWPNGQVIWMDPTADEGLPHTRPPNLICISRDFPQADLANTLLHERVHVSQQLHPRIWLNMFDEWGFQQWHGSLPAELESRRRLNPDLLGKPLYIWKNSWVPFAIFKSTSQPRLKETDVVWWDAKSRTLLRTPPPGWIEFFGHIPAGEHPFEIVAYLVAANPKQNKAYQIIKPRLEKLPTSEV